MDEKRLEEIGKLAIAEHSAWVERNKARAKLRGWLKTYQGATGEWFQRDEQFNADEDITAFDALKFEAKEAQKRLARARSATRRAIVRAVEVSNG